MYRNGNSLIHSSALGWRIDDFVRASVFCQWCSSVSDFSCELPLHSAVRWCIVHIEQHRAKRSSRPLVWESGSLRVRAACLQEHLSPLYDLRGVQTWKERRLVRKDNNNNNNKNIGEKWWRAWLIIQLSRPTDWRWELCYPPLRWKSKAEKKKTTTTKKTGGF